jgi:hypothetical protein
VRIEGVLFASVNVDSFIQNIQFYGRIFVSDRRYVLSDITNMEYAYNLCLVFSESCSVCTN